MRKKAQMHKIRQVHEKITIKVKKKIEKRPLFAQN